jgi:serine phosphatase RsbU (regulator of sigma subunit)
MITKDDITIVEVTDQMILDAVHYAEKSLQYTFNRMGSRNLYDRVRNIVKGILMEAAFKRLLDYHEVKYDLLGHTHWTKRDRYDVGINGWSLFAPQS